MSKRILVVEDQPDSRRIIRDMLAATDYEITEVENGEEALAAIAKHRPDLILMDVQLPIMDGYTATRRIKADPSLRSIPIIAVTSYALDGEAKANLMPRIDGGDRKWSPCRRFSHAPSCRAASAPTKGCGPSTSACALESTTVLT
jgi:two-component system, cell cycle response regulator DivK